MAGVLRREHIRCFDLEQYVEPIREQIRQNAERIAAEHGRQVHCPPSTRFTEGYHWSVMQAEYALDIVFRRAEDLRPVYEEISRQAVLTVKSDQMARFWDKRLSPEAKATSRFLTRVEGTCIRHHLGRQALKMYDRGGRILRIEATSNDITSFSHFCSNRSRSQAPPFARTHPPSRTHLSLLPHQPRPPGVHCRAQIDRTPHHPGAPACRPVTSRLYQFSCAFCAGFPG